MRATRALIHLDNLRSNILQIKSCTSPSVKMCIAVKADAYGHGALECAKVAAECGADYLAIATVDEGRQLREGGIKLPLLMLSLCSPEEVKDAVSLDITPLLFDIEYASLFSQECINAGKKNYPVHLAVDTGMGRIGCLPEEAGILAKDISCLGGIVIAGMCTHFAVSDSLKKEDELYTKKQFELFKKAIENVKAQGINPGICHCCNSAATLNNPEMHMDMVRPGIIVYGYYADEVSREFLEAKGIKIDLQPVMTFETEICSIRNFEKGKSVGYGCTWKAEKDTCIGILPVGYDDGMFRRFSSAGIKVAVNGHNCPVRGRICMDQCMIELEDDKTRRWDKAVIFGDKRFGALQTADDLARLTSTISYEITCGVSKRVPRVFLTSLTR
ncbi:alanine racemase [Treponema sp.]|uniref:alanine racemase n=1 Tax=Treponema sp. TaxID=166 RepID=UPI0025DF9153|nr:alanine racemase [Treponema sp.]MCR5218861.1 alanine racemase [Treponema sp.]